MDDRPPASFNDFVDGDATDRVCQTLSIILEYAELPKDRTTRLYNELIDAIVDQNMLDKCYARLYDWWAAAIEKGKYPPDRRDRDDGSAGV